MSKERMLAPPISTVGTMISTMPATKRDCGLILLLSSLLYLPLFLMLGTPGKDTTHEADSDVACRGVCSCSTTNSLTCSLPTSSSSMSRRPILPRFTASARIAKAPIATAPTALAPTAKAPRAVHARPVATLAKATCAPKGGCSFRLAVRIFFTVLSFPTRLEKTLGANRLHHKHDATVRSPASNFRELRHETEFAESPFHTLGCINLESASQNSSGIHRRVLYSICPGRGRMGRTDRGF